MGCGASIEKNESEKGNNSKQQETGAKNVNATVQNCNENIKLKNANNVHLESNNKSSDKMTFISPQESLEVLVPKPNKPRNSVGKKNSMKSQKSKELKQVQAWGKKTSTTETDFLEDLRTQRRESNPFYEQEYEISEVDETARFIQGGDSGMIIDDNESFNDELSNSSNQVLKMYKEGDQEESFDVSKIIDVEKFRAANVQGEKKGDTDVNNEGGLNVTETTLSEENQIVNRFHEGVKEETLNDDLYNEDDKHLIESIEKEFLITQDNFLPGQIVN